MFMSISRDCMGFPPSDENTKNYFQNAPTDFSAFQWRIHHIRPSL
jgi:hypothetical protein